MRSSTNMDFNNYNYNCLCYSFHLQW
jgi:hypothetical protein